MFRASVAPPAGCILIPQNYRGTGVLGQSRDESFSTTNSAQLAYNIDTFRAWLAQNGQGVPAILNGALTVAAGGASLFGGLATGNLVGGTMGAANAVSSLIGQISDISAKSKAAPSVQGSQSPTLQYISASSGVGISFAQIRADNARIIDDYFTRYGYAVRRVETPVLNARENFTYIKMQSPCITGNCPQDVLTAYHNAFMQGITYWMDGDKIGDYSVSNRPWNEVNT